MLHKKGNVLINNDNSLILKVVRLVLGHSFKDDPTWTQNIFNFTKKRMDRFGLKKEEDYINLLYREEDELNHFIHNITIHKTNFFREPDYLKFLESEIKEYHLDKPFPFKVLSLGCSTGEEVYSLALYLESIRKKNPTFDYRISGVDVDRISVQKAVKGIYGAAKQSAIPNVYQKYLVEGTDKFQGYFTFRKEIRRRCHFSTFNLYEGNFKRLSKYDLILCRNVLIYFSQSVISRVLLNIGKRLKKNGLYIAGITEKLDDLTSLKKEKHFIYRKDQEELIDSHQLKGKMVLVFNASPMSLARVNTLFRAEYVQIIDTHLPVAADQVILKQSVSMIVVDVAHKENTIQALDWLASIRALHLNIPTVIISNNLKETDLELYKRNIKTRDCISEERLQTSNYLLEKLNHIVNAKHNIAPNLPDTLPPLSRNIKVILIGSSTGGVAALSKLLAHLDKTMPPIVLVQHIETSFADSFVSSLERASGLPVITKDKQVLKPGNIYCVDQDVHIKLIQTDEFFMAKHSDDPPVASHRPSVDHLFNSAVTFASHALVILLTGMGSDGARGMSSLYHNGAATMVQDEESCVSFGMPKEALSRGCVHYCGNIEQLREKMDTILQT